MKEYWSTIYRTHPNDIHEEWNEEIKEVYTEEIDAKERSHRIIYERRNDVLRIPKDLREHYDGLRGRMEPEGRTALRIHYNKEERTSKNSKTNTGTYGCT
ncbi:MAG: hypothetical protein ACK5JS_08815 [Mangrovibacterium sp.]